MLVKYNQPSLLAFGYNQGTNANDIVLKPGLNEVDASLWKKHKDHPVIKLKLEEGLIEVVGEEEKPEEKPSKVLTSLKPNEAMSAIKDTVDEKILEDWLSKEKRPNVKKAIQKQLDELRKPVEYREKKNSEQPQGE